MFASIEARDASWAHEAHWRHVSAAKDRLLAVVRAELHATEADETPEARPMRRDSSTANPGGQQHDLET